MLLALVIELFQLNRSRLMILAEFVENYMEYAILLPRKNPVSYIWTKASPVEEKPR